MVLKGVGMLFVLLSNGMQLALSGREPGMPTFLSCTGQTLTENYRLERQWHLRGRHGRMLSLMKKYADDLVKIQVSCPISEKVIHLLMKSFWGGTHREQPRLQNYSSGSGATNVPESLLPQAPS